MIGFAIEFVGLVILWGWYWVVVGLDLFEGIFCG